MIRKDDPKIVRTFIRETCQWFNRLVDRFDEARNKHQGTLYIWKYPI